MPTQASMPHDTDRIQDSTDSAGGPWLPWKDASKVRFTPPANLVPNEVVQGVLDGKYGSVPSIGPARARVRGTDAKCGSGTLVTPMSVLAEFVPVIFLP